MERPLTKFSKELIDEGKRIFEPRAGHTISDEEMHDWMNTLTEFFSLLDEIDRRTKAEAKPPTVPESKG